MTKKGWSRFCITTLVVSFMLVVDSLSVPAPGGGTGRRKPISMESEDGSGSGSTWLWPTPIFNCTPIPLQPKATNVNQLRFQDIKAFMTVGDSISAGNAVCLVETFLSFLLTYPTDRMENKTKGSDCTLADCTIHSIWSNTEERCGTAVLMTMLSLCSTS